MKKLALKVALLTVLVTAVLITVNSLYLRTQGYKNKLTLQQWSKLQSVPGGLTVVNFGSSHGADSFDYHGTGLRGFNFGLASQDFYYDYQLARRFRDKLAKGCVVLIPVSYLSFGIKSQFMEYDYRYYGILPYGDIRGHNPLDYFKFRWCPVLFEDVRLAWIVHDQSPTDHEYKQLTKNNVSADSLRSSGRSAAADVQKQIKDQPESVFYFNSAYLDKLVLLCQKEDWRPVLVTTPFSQYYTCNFSQAFLDDFHARVEKVSKKYGVPYLDFSDDASFSGNIAIFKNADHLNVPGGVQFTRAVIDKLKGMGLLPDGSTR